MISLDSNIVLSALNPKDVNHGRAIAALNQYSNQAFCLSPVVRAELLASESWPALDAWLTMQAVAVIWEMPESVWDNAGKPFGQYARARKIVPAPRRLVADLTVPILYLQRSFANWLDSKQVAMELIKLALLRRNKSVANRFNKCAGLRN